MKYNELIDTLRSYAKELVVIIEYLGSTNDLEYEYIIGMQEAVKEVKIPSYEWDYAVNAYLYNIKTSLGYYAIEVYKETEELELLGLLLKVALLACPYFEKQVNELIEEGIEEGIEER